MEQAANYLNSLFTGRDLREVRHRLLDEMRHTHDHMDRLMRQAVDLARQVVEVAEDKDKDDLCVAGQTNLMDFSELASMDRLKQLFEAFAEKRQILHLLDRCLEAEGVQIFVGEESGYELLGGCSLVSAPYQIDGKVIGVLGVIGPARMNYSPRHPHSGCHGAPAGRGPQTWLTLNSWIPGAKHPINPIGRWKWQWKRKRFNPARRPRPWLTSPWPRPMPRPRGSRILSRGPPRPPVRHPPHRREPAQT